MAALIVGLFFVGANALHAPPPEAMVVEVVTPDELPRFEGTPSARHSSGSETPSPSVGKGAVTQAPPPVRVETQTVTPGPNYIWTPGYWRWTGTSYVWVSGSWVVRPRVTAVWVEGHWVHRPGGWVWIAGHWR